MRTVGEVLRNQLILVSIFWVSWVNPTVPMTLPLHGNTGVPSGMNGSTQTKDSVSGANHDFKVMKNPLSFSQFLFRLTISNLCNHTNLFSIFIEWLELSIMQTFAMKGSRICFWIWMTIGYKKVKCCSWPLQQLATKKIIKKENENIGNLLRNHHLYDNGIAIYIMRMHFCINLNIVQK